MPEISLDDALGSIGLSFADLCASATEIVVFGSRAAGISHAQSDWDILCVGSGTSRAAPRIDLVWVTEEEVRSEDWTGSELAGHIEAWGRWIWGAPKWLADVSLAPSEVARKARRVAARARALESSWDELAAHHRRKYVTLLRRDLLRYGLLSQQRSVPPTAYLDATLSAGSVSEREILELAERLEIRRLLSWFVTTQATPGGRAG